MRSYLGQFYVLYRVTFRSLYFTLMFGVLLLAQAAAQTVPLQIDVGSSTSFGAWVADTDQYGGTNVSTTNPIDTSGVLNAPPPAIYQSNRVGSSFSYTIYSLTAGARYSIRLHFAEIYWSSAGQRQFNVAINGTQVLSNFDIVAFAGAPNKAIALAFQAIANGSGQSVYKIDLQYEESKRVDQFGNAFYYQARRSANAGG